MDKKTEQEQTNPTASSPRTETTAPSDGLPGEAQGQIRAIGWSDVGAYRAFLAALAPEDLQMRVMGAMSAVPDRELPRLLHADGRSSVVLALEVEEGPGDKSLLAVARAFVAPAGRDGEFAVIVRSDHLGQRLGERMIDALIQWARDRRLAALVGETLHENTRMLALAKRMGFSQHWDSDSRTMRLRLALTRACDDDRSVRPPPERLLDAA